MAELVQVHSDTPKPRRIRRVADALRAGAVIAYPTDSSYALACAMGQKAAIDKIRRLRQLGRDHLFSLLCRDLSEIATYAKVANANFRLRSEEHTSELQSRGHLVCRLLLEKKK